MRVSTAIDYRQAFCCSCRLHWKKFTVIPRISALGAYSLFDFCMGAYLKWDLVRGGALKIFFVVGHVPDEIFLLVNHFFDATHTSNRIFSKDKQILVN